MLDPDEAAGFAHRLILAEVVDEAGVFAHPVLTEVRHATPLRPEEGVLADGLD